MRWGRAAAVAGLALLLGAPAGAEDGLAACLAPLLAAEVEAKRDFQTGLADLIASEAPRNADLARLSAELQIALAERRAVRTEALARWRSDALLGPEDLNGFAWTEADEARLVAEVPTYAELAARTDLLGSRNNAHPGWPALRTAYGQRIAPHPDHGALMTRLIGEIETLEAEMAGCFAG